MEEYLWRESLYNPVMQKRLIRGDAGLRVPVEAALDEIVEELTLAAHHTLQGFCARDPELAA